ncbi:MAG: hypothetical protein AABY07_06930, partial [Nanoarchaeota archaeon]
MKCEVCKINETEKNSIVCSARCNKLRLDIIRLANKYTPTNGCENCWEDLGQGCTEKCKDEFKKAGEFVGKLNQLARVLLNGNIVLPAVLDFGDYCSIEQHRYGC